MRTRVLGITVILSALLFSGCDQFDNVTQQDISGIGTSGEYLDKDYAPITLPQRSTQFRDSIYSISKEIDGISGGSINYHNYFISIDGDSVVFDFNLFIPPFSFQGTNIITVTFDSIYANFQFDPHITFQRSVFLTQSFNGLTLDSLQSGTTDFVFINENGLIEILKKNGVQVIVPQGTVRVLYAQLNHFSRYGWVRKIQ